MLILLFSFLFFFSFLFIYLFINFFYFLDNIIIIWDNRSIVLD